MRRWPWAAASRSSIAAGPTRSIARRSRMSARPTALWPGLAGAGRPRGGLARLHRTPPDPGGARFTMEVALVERLGPVSLVTPAHGDAARTARLEGRCPWRQRTAVEVELALGQAHLFDQATGRAPSHGRPK